MGLGSGLGTAAAVTVMPIGDSLTDGVGTNPADSCKNAGYRYQLWNRASALLGKVQMVGTSSSRGDADFPQRQNEGNAADSLSLIQARIVTRVPVQCPEVIILYGGVIDCIALTPAATSLALLDTMVRQCFDYGTRPGANTLKLLILCQTTTSSSGGADAIVKTYNAGMPAIAAAHRAAGRNVQPANLDGACPFNVTNFGDTVHMTPVGYTLVAQAMIGLPGQGLLADYTR